MTDMQLFDNGEFALEITKSGDSFTVAAPSLARALGFRDAFRLVESLPSDEKGYTTACTPGGEQRMWHVTEAGFYRALGQRQVARIRDKRTAASVERFQSWVYGTVLPAIRRTGGYMSERANYADHQPRNAMEDYRNPTTYTWDEVAALIHQRTGIPMTVNELTRTLRTGGVLKQNGSPTAKYRFMFWFTGSSWNVHPHEVPKLTYKVFDTGRELQDFRFIQARLELEGVGQSVSLPVQRQPGMPKAVRSL